MILDDSVDVEPGSPLFQEHLSRYWWARQFAVGGDVLDCACGKGYGSFVLASGADSVLGIDINPRSLDMARSRFRRPNLSFLHHDALDLASVERKFDLITAFEIIEHIPSSLADRFLAGLASALKPRGRVVISTPNHVVVSRSGVVIPEYHVNNYTPRRLGRSLKRHFGAVTLLGQFRQRRRHLQLLFDIDIWNLRHVLGRPFSRRAGMEPVPVPVADPPDEFFERPPDELEAYRFSPRHWRQAGITVAVCEGSGSRA